MRQLFLACCLVTLLAGCTDKAKDLYDTAQLEEKQFNKAARDGALPANRRAISQFTLREPTEESFGRTGEALIREGVRGGVNTETGAIVSAPPIRSPIACAPPRRPAP
jgi:hypothetical protein